MKRTRLRPVSAKRRARQGEHAAAVELVFDRDRNRCRLRDMLVGHRCSGPLTPHHLLKQSQGGGDDPELMVALCAGGNTWVEDHPTLAHEMGLVIRREDL